jgi:hypothetical protein
MMLTLKDRADAHIFEVLVKSAILQQDNSKQNRQLAHGR